MSIRKRGRPRKFDRPSRVVALTLPEDVITALRARERDLARAVVALVDEAQGKVRPTKKRSAIELVQAAPRRFLIAVDSRVVDRLPGCELVPFGPHTALLALEPGHKLSDLALAVADRLEEPRLDAREREALAAIRAALRQWMRDPKLSAEVRGLVVLRRVLHGAVLLPSSVRADDAMLAGGSAADALKRIPELAVDCAAALLPLLLGLS